MARWLSLGSVLASSLIPAQAAIYQHDFNTDPTLAAQPITLTGNAVWVESGGVDGTGYVSVTDAINSQQGVVVLPQLDADAIGGFKADFDIRIGGGTARPADGMAFVFAPEVDESSNFGEEGMGTGVVVSFDTWDNNGTDTAPAIDVKVGGTADANIVSTTFLGGQREGNRARPGPIFKDPDTGADVDLSTGANFAPLSVQVRDGLLNVSYKGYQLVKDVVVAFDAVPGRFAFGARTGNANDNHWVDNLRIETFPRTAPSVASLRSSASGFTIRIQDSPNSAVDASSFNVTVDGAAVPNTATKEGDITTFTYTGTTLWEPNSSHAVVVRYKHGTTGVDAATSFSVVVPAYTLVTAADKPAAGIVTAERGFIWNVHQVDSLTDLANNNERTEQQLAGLLGANVADPNAQGPAAGTGTPANPGNNPIRFVIPGVINFSQAEGDANGNATPDLAMPGIPGLGDPANNTDSVAAEVLHGIEFPAAGFYTLIVNSDDGFRTSIGTNPRDLFAKRIGEFSGGRGATDSPFNVYVESPGTYLMRTTWQEGGGGANIEILSQLSDGTKVLLNDDATNPDALKTFQVNSASLPTYVRSVSPTINARSPGRPKTVEAVIVSGSDAYTAGSASLKLNGATVPVTATTASGATTVKHTVVGDLLPNTEYTAELTYSTTAGPRTVSWKFTTGNLSSTLFLIEAEDFDYTDDLGVPGRYNPRAGQAGQDVNVMPYLGGAYQDLSATELIDFVNNDGFDSDVYRTELGEDGDHEVNINDNLGAGPGNGLGDGVIPIAGNDRGSWTMTANYKIGWVENTSWNNYTRDFPTTGTGWWKVYAALSFDGNAAGQLSASMQKITAGAGTTDQTVEQLGSFSSNGSGGWGPNNLVPMRNASGGDAIVKLRGKETVRFTMGSGDFDFILLSQAAPPPPFLSGTPGPDSFKSTEVNLLWTISDTDSKVDVSTVRVTVAGQDVTSAATITKTDTGATIALDRTGTEFAAGEVPWTVVFRDNSSPAQEVSASGAFVVNPLGTPGTIVIEAEDFNYTDDAGVAGKTNPQAGTPDLDVNVMPYLGGAYQGLSATENIDYVNNDGNDSDQYRAELDENGENEVNIAADTGNRYSVDRGTYTATQNFRIGWVEGGSWQNYTRTFPAGDYNVWAALSYDGRGANQLNGSLDLVTSDPAAVNQTVTRLGSFSAPGSGGWGRNELVPMKNAAGQISTVRLGGTQTVRFNLGSGDFDYILLIPTLTDVTAPGDTITGFGGTSPGGEPVAMAINNQGQKYLNFGGDGNTSAPFVGPVGLVVTPAAGASVVSGLRIYTANDAPDRDPADYILEGSNDGTTFTQISAGALALPAARNGGGTAALNPATSANQEVWFANTRSFTTYRVTFTNVKNNAAANSMQIAEIELLGTVGSSGEIQITIARGAGNAINISWNGGGSLQASPAAAGAGVNWQTVDSDGSYSTTTAGAAMYFRVMKP